MTLSLLGLGHKKEHRLFSVFLPKRLRFQIFHEFFFATWKRGKDFWICDVASIHYGGRRWENRLGISFLFGLKNNREEEMDAHFIFGLILVGFFFWLCFKFRHENKKNKKKWPFMISLNLLSSTAGNDKSTERNGFWWHLRWLWQWLFWFFLLSCLFLSG